MRSHHNIVETYRTAGSEERLNIFLECPEHRTAFIEIETREVLHKVPAKSLPFWKRLFSIGAVF
jgi:hypothetical protein